MSGIFKDWIPEGEDAGAQVGQVFADFVPVAEPKKEPVVEVSPEVSKEAPVKAKKEFACDKCDFKSPFRLALAGHRKSHKK